MPAEEVATFVNDYKPCGTALRILNQRTSMEQAWNMSVNGHWLMFIIRKLKLTIPEEFEAQRRELSDGCKTQFLVYQKAIRESPNETVTPQQAYNELLKAYAQEIRANVPNPYPLAP